MISRLAREWAEAEREADALGEVVPRKPGASSWRLTVLLALVLALLALFKFTPLGELLHNLERLRAFIDGFGVRGEITFAALTGVLMAIGSPRLIFYGIGGVLFGFWEGLAAALAGSLLGSLVMFRVARWGGRHWVRRRFGEHRLFGPITRMRPTVMAVVMVRQLPLSNVFINVGLALSRVPGRTFLLGTLIGFLPQGVIASLVGSGLANADEWQGVLQTLTALALAGAIGVWALRRRATRSPDARGR